MAISDLDYTDDSDVALIRRTRTGDTDAYGLLHQRHAGSARALAWRMSRSASDADDLVSEGFARVLAALQRGGGPDSAFRPYLLSTIRRLAYDRTIRERRESPVEQEIEEDHVGDDPVVAGFERETAAAAFASLPERWRMVLWHTEVEGESPAEVATLLGMTPNAVAALAYRAREGLRQAYLSHHAGPEHELSRECRHAADRLGAYVRGGLASGQQDRVAGHLDECDRCQAAYLELATVNTSMRSVLAPIVLGPAAAAGYLAELAGPTAAATAGVGGAAGAAVGGRAVVRGIRRALGTPARSAVAAGVATVVAVSVGFLAARGTPAQEVAAGPSPVVVGPSTPPSTSPPLVPESDSGVLSADVQRSTTTSTATPSPPAVASGRSAPPVSRTDSALEVPAPAPPAPPITTSAATVPAATTPPITTTTAPPIEPPATTLITTTTAPPTTTTPLPLSKLEVSLASAGNVVAGRPGVLVAAISNTGEGDGHGVRLQLDLEGVARRGLPRRSAAVDTPATPAWTCTSDDPATLTCTADALAAGAVSSIYIPVLAPADSQQARVRASVTGSADAADAGAAGALDLAVQPVGMAARFAAVERGDVVAVGNTLVTCPVESPGCPEARLGQGTRLDNGNHPMVAVDTDADPATANSSSAVSTCPGGPAVLSATLYWGGDLSPGPGGQPPADPSAAGRAVVVTPGGSRSEVIAERVDPVATRYQAVADVTDLVASGGAGSWTVGGVQLATGENTYGGWTLLVACGDPAAPHRSLVVLDGLTEVRSGSAVTLEVGGFSVPPAGSGAATVTTVTYEGDLGLAGDQLTVIGRALADALNPLGNTFNSTASLLGLPAVGSVPDDPNRFGFDLDRFDLAGAIAPGATSTILEFTTAADVYLPGVVAFAVDQ